MVSFLILITVISTTYYNFNKKKVYDNYKNTIHNVYFKKTIKGFNFKILSHSKKQISKAEISKIS